MISSKKRILKRIVWTLLIGFIAIQFIQPARNKSGQVLSTDFSLLYHPPQKVEAVLKNSCFDCHSNNTRYPWYSSIQPFAWFMAGHIRKGKAKLNFSEYGTLPLRRQISKLKNIEGSIKDGSMPLSSYKLIHKNARISPSDKQMITDWLEKTRDSLSRK